MTFEDWIPVVCRPLKGEPAKGVKGLLFALESPEIRRVHAHIWITEGPRARQHWVLEQQDYRLEASITDGIEEMSPETLWGPGTPPKAAAAPMRVGSYRTRMCECKAIVQPTMVTGYPASICTQCRSWWRPGEDAPL